jgi:acyl-homoserine-lactone acylase
MLVSLVMAGCASAPPPPRYDVEVTRTEFGIPHVRAANTGSLGYGIGYAYAQDNFCILAEKMLQLSGSYSRHFGGDARVQSGTSQTISSRDSDFFYRSQISRRQLAEQYGRGRVDLQELTAGYVAGINRYLSDTGAENLPEPCRGAAWVRPLTVEDLYVWATAVATLAGNQTLIEATVTAKPPAPSVSRSGDDMEHTERPTLAPDNVAADNEARLGSNAWAFGSEVTASGRGLLFGNPHWSWGDIHQFYQAHLTIPGKLDVMGVTYGALPMIAIGFNDSIAWSHTVSTGARSVIRELTLADDSPTAYIIDGERRAMEAVTVTIDVRAADGTLQQESRTLYSTEFGPVIVRPSLPWNTTTAYALTDLNLPNHRMMEQWWEIGQARNVAALRSSLERVMGIPWVNTLAADRDGRVLYADYSVKPYVTDEMLASCGGSETARRLAASGVIVLDGSRSACNPATDAATPQAGILPPRLLPALERADYVANSNNSYWLTNPAQPITGLPSVNGPGAAFIGFRPQSGLRIIEAHLDGSGPLEGNRFDAAAIKALVFGHAGRSDLGNQNRAAEVSLDALRTACTNASPVRLADGSSVDIAEACRILSGWDGRHAIDSVGAHIFYELWPAASRIPRLWKVPFDPARALETPREPAVDDPAVREALRQEIAKAAAKLKAASVPLDAPWGTVHWHPLGTERIPIPGSSQETLNMMVGGPLTSEGYRGIRHGTSYVQIVGFDDEGPVADAVLLFGQSTNPASPHYFDQLQRLWVAGSWHRLPFRQQEIERNVISRIRLQGR